MSLTSQQIELLQQALLDGFPTKDHLTMLLRVKLDVVLDAVAEAEDNTLRTFKIITWAERTGNVRRLIDGAVAQMPGNSAVKKLKKASLHWALDMDGETTLTSDAILLTADSDPVEHDYLKFLYAHCQHLDFKGMGMADLVPLQLLLIDVYVPLKVRVVSDGEAWSHEPRLTGRKMTRKEAGNIGDRLSGPQPVLDLLQRHAGLVILGDPGAGKTTFLKYLSVLLALDRGAEAGLNRRLPVLVPLSAYAAALAQHDVSLQTFMGDYYRSCGLDLPVDQLIGRALEQGNALVMLDGLDEVQQLAQRTLVVQRVEEFFDFQRKRGNKFILTSRIVGYRNVRPVAEDLKECTLVDFDSDDIMLFWEKWTQALERATKGTSTAMQLAAAKEKAELLFVLERKPGVRQLAANPLLLTILALMMKRQGLLLPERRVQVYDQYVQTLLRHWNLSRGLDRRVASDLDVLEMTRVLAPLALWMQESSSGAGLVKGEALRFKLEAIYAERRVDDPEASARQLLADARDYASLLLERSAGEFGFIHLTFQEYLAAVAVAQRGQSDLQPVVDILAKQIDDPRWREVALLTIGHVGIIQQRDEAASDVLLRLLECKPGEAGAAVVLAGEAVLDVWPGGVTHPCRDTVKAALLVTMADSSQAPPSIRARAGSLLGALGDPRNLEEMVLVPGGPFIMGEDRKGADEEPRHEVDLSSFFIARYPVTNQQYAEFVAATRRSKPPQHWRGLKPPRELWNHPVVNVTWHDACAYCRWLSEMRGEKVRLPTEAEWEKAARGIDGRVYPWGSEDADPNRANYNDSQIGGTSPVGCFPGGQSPYGCFDMAGNVFEWTSTLYKPYRYQADDGREDPNPNGTRIVRGGAWWTSGEWVRCACRNRHSPWYKDYRRGFRLARDF
jgi:formylglycine-generating enzyme required for sulfatase activity